MNGTETAACGAQVVNVFYSSVILNGTETYLRLSLTVLAFYSSVILNGTETELFLTCSYSRFYSSVILNGTETECSQLINALVRHPSSLPGSNNAKIGQTYSFGNRNRATRSHQQSDKD